MISPQPHDRVADLADDEEERMRRNSSLGDRARASRSTIVSPERTRISMWVKPTSPDEQQGEDADQRVHAHLGEQAGEERRDRPRRRVVRGRQPEEQREHGGLDAERDQEQHRHGRHRTGRVSPVQLAGEVGHVQRAGHAVEDADRGQEHGRRHQVERDVLDAPVQLRRAPRPGPAARTRPSA